MLYEASFNLDGGGSGCVWSLWSNLPDETVVHVSSQVPTYLYSGQASKLEGNVKKRGGDNFGWRVNGAVTWEVEIAKSGEYAVGLCHAAEPGYEIVPVSHEPGLFLE